MRTGLSLLVLGTALVAACGPPRPARESAAAVEVPSASAPAASASAPGWQPARQRTAGPPRESLERCTPGTTDLASARQLFQEGLQAYQRGEFAAAQASFERVYRQTCNPNVLYNIGTTREMQNDVEGAIEAFELYLSTEPGNRRASDVQERLRALDGRR